MSNETGKRPGLKIEPFALALTVLLFAEHLIFGANRNDLGLIFAAAHLLLLLLLILVSRGAEPPRLPLATPGVLMALVFALGIFSVLPLGPPLAHPAWSYVQGLTGARGSISLDPVATRLQMVKLAGFIALFLVAASLGARRDAADSLGRYLTWGGILYGLWAAVSWVLWPNEIFGAPRPYGEGRLSASFLSANTAATLFAGLAVFGVMGALRPLLRERDKDERPAPAEWAAVWPQALLAVTALACLLLTASRGGLLAFAAALLFGLAVGAWMKSSRQSLGGGFLAAVCLVLFASAAFFVMGGEHAAARLTSTNPLTEDRLAIFSAYWPTIQASPWFGYGLGAFNAFNAASMTAGNALSLTILGAAHNVYLQWMLQMGLPGAAYMFGAVAWVLLATVRGAGRRSSQQGLLIGALAVAVVFAVHGLVDYALEVPSMAALFSVMLGFGFGLAERPSSGRGRGRRQSDRVRPDRRLSPRSVAAERTSGGSRRR